MTVPLIAHHREPLAQPWGAALFHHVSQPRGHCGHCGNSNPGRWRIHTVDGTWMCECFWYPERRPRYQVPETERRRLTFAGAMATSPTNEAEPVRAWWVQ